jgi:hypothetical protein
MAQVLQQRRELCQACVCIVRKHNGEDRRVLAGGCEGTRDMLVQKRMRQAWIWHGGLEMRGAICGHQLRRRRGRSREWSAGLMGAT